MMHVEKDKGLSLRVSVSINGVKKYIYVAISLNDTLLKINNQQN